MKIGTIALLVIGVMNRSDDELRSRHYS